MSDLRDRFEDLVVDVPTYVVPDVAAAGRAGARRRRVRRTATSVVASCVAALAAAVVVGPPVLPDVQPADADSATVDGHPARVDAPVWTGDLPARPGPLAGLYSPVDSLTWHAISARGEVWDLDFAEPGGAGSWPSLSDDGARLAYLDSERTFAVRDLRSGRDWAFPKIGDGSLRPGAPELFWSGQTPVRWSPSGDQLLLLGGSLRSKRGDGPVLIDLTAGTARVLDVRGRWPAGWLDEERFVQVDPQRGRVLTVDTSGTVLGEAALQPFPSRDLWSQFSPSLDADSRVVTMTTQGFDPDGEARTFRYDLDSGRRLDEPARTAHAGDHCEVSRAIEGPALTTRAADGPTSLESVDGDRLVVLDPALDADCVTFAAAALAGPVRAGLLDRALGAAGLEPTDGTGSWLGWHRQEVAAGLLVTVGLLVLLGPLRRRRARPAHH